ncbi:MAG: DUF123 domain-containing protein [Gammaproteobacteria bacterium]
MRPVDTATLIAELDALPGTYVLLLHCARRVLIGVGRRIPAMFAPGWYLYVGSAQGPGGVRARLGRHLRGDGRVRWHIDYLRRTMDPAGAWVAYGHACLEHTWARELAGQRGLDVIAGIGASDCDCASHLFHARRRPCLAAFATALGDAGSRPPQLELGIRAAGSPYTDARSTPTGPDSDMSPT